MLLKVESKNILKAAEKCPQAKMVLTELFPEVFTPKEPSYPKSIIGLSYMPKDNSYSIALHDDKKQIYTFGVAKNVKYGSLIIVSLPYKDKAGKTAGLPGRENDIHTFVNVRNSSNNDIYRVLYHEEGIGY